MRGDGGGDGGGSDLAWLEEPDSACRGAILHLAATRVAIAFAWGILLGWIQPRPWVWPWVVVGAGALVLAGRAVCRRQTRLLAASILVTTLALGAAWVTLRHFYVPADGLAAMLRDEPVLVRVRGVVRTSPVLRDRATGSMAIFSHQPPAAYFNMEVEAMLPREAPPVDASGVVLVRCDESLHGLRPGDRVEVFGRLGRFPPASNPGEFDRAHYARVLGQAGMLRAPQRELVRLIEQRRDSITDHLAHWREQLRRRASAWVLSNLPPGDRTERDALLAAILLGEREPELMDLGETFRRVGLAHLLAISGLHLGVLAGAVLLFLRVFGPARAWHGWILIAVIVVYVFLIEARMPVLRAALMTCAAATGVAFGQRLRIGGLVGLSALALLIWKPQQLFDAGFQLSYGIVLGLIYFTPRFRERWFGRPDHLAPSSSAMLGEWLKNIGAASVVAWAIATPLVAHHFGLVTPLAAAASVTALPVVTGLLAIGYWKMILGAVLPSAGFLLGAPLTLAADVLVSVVQMFDALPFSVIRVMNPAAAWTILALLLLCAWFLHVGRTQRRVLWTCSAGLLVWAAWPSTPLAPEPHLRIDMLSVGDGSCYVVRSGGSTVLFDAGSSTDLDAGHTMIVPALERLGVRDVDAIAISHANLDHFSAVIEVAERFDTSTVLVTPQFLREASADLLGPAAFLHDELSRRFIAIETVSAGAMRTFGEATWTWLHPTRDDAFRLANDSSMVIRIETAGRRILLTGDVQREAMAMLLDDDAALRADVMELPHHGSFHELAVDFVERVDPAVALQSTGWTRFSRDRWAGPLAGAERLVTARDGACWVEIAEDGRITAGRFRDVGATAD